MRVSNWGSFLWAGKLEVEEDVLEEVITAKGVSQGLSGLAG